MSHRGLLHHMIINVADVKRSSPFYTGMFRYLGYELNDSSYGEDYAYEDWKRWDLDTPHEISICQVCDPHKGVAHQRGALGHHCHVAFCADDRDDVDRFHREVLLPLSGQGHCHIEDAPCDCPEYGDGYYATFFTDPDGLKYEFVINPNHLIKRANRQTSHAHL
jgi:glyoxylase I family protein